MYYSEFICHYHLTDYHLTDRKAWSSMAVHKLDARVTSSIYLEQTKVAEERATFSPHSKFNIGQQVVTFMI